MIDNFGLTSASLEPEATAICLWIWFQQRYDLGVAVVLQGGGSSS